MTQYSVANNFFGPDYAGSDPEFVGSFTVKANRPPVDISYSLGGISMSLLPPGGYIIRYVSGSFLIMSRTPTFLVIGGADGLHVEWMANKARSWSTAPFNIIQQASDEQELRRLVNPNAVNNIMQLEFTKPHRLRLIPPQHVIGEAKFKIMRYRSGQLAQPAEEDIIRESNSDESVSS